MLADVECRPRSLDLHAGRRRYANRKTAGRYIDLGISGLIDDKVTRSPTGLDPGEPDHLPVLRQAANIDARVAKSPAVELSDRPSTPGAIALSRAGAVVAAQYPAAGPLTEGDALTAHSDPLDKTSSRRELGAPSPEACLGCRSRLHQVDLGDVACCEHCRPVDSLELDGKL